MRVKLIIGDLSIKTRPWWAPWSKAPKIYKEENLHQGELVHICRTDEVTERGTLTMYWAKDPSCSKGDKFVLMKVDPYYHEEWLAGDACRILGIPRPKAKE